MGVHAALAVALENVERRQRFNGFDDEAGLLPELAGDRLENRLAELLDAAGETPFADVRRAGALHQQHASVAADDAEHTDDRPVRVVAGHDYS
jgi:hypothetical protein